ncbi:uncharacterized protein LOC127094666 [Lathyrus oleraceus]|uniref:uncharacterized protein LOC127094666 n=1 Tax=Pisum sativum TaxID=3888 RepID=UPI0021D1B373|nr:uncharacterized protein LOC127094666 [Pisum sativum]
MAMNNLQFHQQTDSSIQTLQTQIGQLSILMNAMQQAQGPNQLPARTILNPKGPNANVSEISLRSRKVTEPSPEKNKKILEVTPEPSSVVIETKPSVVVDTEKEKEKEHVPLVPFPHRILKSKRTGDGDKEREILDVFRKVAVNIPLLDVIKQVPKYAKFLKDLCTSINVMPISVYNNLDLGPLQHTNFYILDMYGETNSSRSPIILGRPFMKTGKTKIYVDDGTMSMEFGDIVTKFNFFDAMKQPLEEHSIFHIELISELVDDTFS